jgi:hypothetical protein
MNPFLLGPRERLADWKQFRKGLDITKLDDALAATAKYWAQAPLARYSYDAHDASTWPGIWEMITENVWCEHSTAIGMWHTLHLAGLHPDRMRLTLINDRDLSEIKFVLEIDGLKWLNYHYGIASDLPETNRIVMCSWRFDGKKFVSTNT